MWNCQGMKTESVGNGESPPSDESERPAPFFFFWPNMHVFPLWALTDYYLDKQQPTVYPGR